MISTVIFDLDGTVISDEDEYGNAFRIILKTLEVDVKSKYPHIGGIGVEENWEVFIEKYHIKTNLTPSELAGKTQEEYLKQIGSIEVREGFVNFVEELRIDGIKIGLATSNTWVVVDKLFQVLKLEKYFDVVTTREEVIFSKPDPEIFNITAEKLSVSNKDCVVFEDSASGIKAAISAGMKAVGIARDTIHAKELSGANLVIFNYSDISFDKLVK